MWSEQHSSHGFEEAKKDFVIENNVVVGQNFCLTFQRPANICRRTECCRQLLLPDRFIDL